MNRVGIAADHGGFALKGQMAELLRGSGYIVVDFGAHQLDPEDDYPDFIIPLAKAIATGEVERGVALCGSGVGASIAANKVPGVRAGLIHDVFSARQGVEDDEMNVICLGEKVIGSALAWDLVEAFLDARFSGNAPTSPAPPRQSEGAWKARTRAPLRGNSRCLRGSHGTAVSNRSEAERSCGRVCYLARVVSCLAASKGVCFLMLRTILCCLVMLTLSVGCQRQKRQQSPKKGRLPKWTPPRALRLSNCTRMARTSKATFKLAERIEEYMDSAGDVATADIFTSGDRVLIFESEGTITKMKHKDKAAIAKLPEGKDKADKEAKSANETFVRAADQINLADMKLGKVAEENAKSDVVKKFGVQAVTDHSLMNKELRKIATKQGIALTEKLDPKHQELLDDLTKLKEVAFDKAYTKDMVADHEKAIELFENEVKTGRDTDVKAWAEKCLPTLREHLKSAQAAVNDVKGK